MVFTGTRVTRQRTQSTYPGTADVVQEQSHENATDGREHDEGDQNLGTQHGSAGHLTQEPEKEANKDGHSDRQDAGKSHLLQRCGSDLDSR